MKTNTDMRKRGWAVIVAGLIAVALVGCDDGGRLGGGGIAGDPGPVPPPAVAPEEPTAPAPTPVPEDPGANPPGTPIPPAMLCGTSSFNAVKCAIATGALAPGNPPSDADHSLVDAGNAANTAFSAAANAAADALSLDAEDLRQRVQVVPTPPPSPPEAPAENIPPLKAREVLVTIHTGATGDDAGTHCDAYIKFCKDAAMEDCTGERMLNDPNSSGRRTGERSVRSLMAPESDITDAHRYFQLRLDRQHCEARAAWLLQGIYVNVKYDGNRRYQYNNPCLEKWMGPDDALPFGPNDTAVCAIVSTGTQPGSGTDDPVFLVLDNTDVDLARKGYQKTQTALRDWSSHFINTADGEDTALEMFWDGRDNLSDFEYGETAPYGDYLFDVMPFEGNPRFHFQKGRDRDDDGAWLLNTAEIFVFQPGKYLNGPGGPTGYSGSFRYHEWLGGDADLSSSFRDLPLVLNFSIPDDIGERWRN